MNSADCRAWEGFFGVEWREEINPAAFIRLNYTPYDGDESFLAGATAATARLWAVADSESTSRTSTIAADALFVNQCE